MSRGKFFIVNGQAKTNPPAPPSPPLSTLSAMTVGGWGDPHMYITTSSLDSKNRATTKTIAQWGDNKPGTSGNNELLLLDLQTPTNTIKVYYTNKAYGSAKVISNIRVIHNTVSTTYNATTKFAVGPVNINILKIGSGNNTYLNFEMSWSNINNVVKLGGAIVPILKRVALSNGKLWNGGDGLLWDGFGKALAPYGLSRSSFETGIGIQSTEEELILSEKEANFLTIATENFTQNSNVFDNLQNLGENGEGDNAAVGDWDPTHAEVLPILSDSVGLEGVVDVALGNPTTTTTTTTTTAAPTTTTTTTVAPSSSYTVSGLGEYNVDLDGCYTLGGTYNDRPYYVNQYSSSYIFFDSAYEIWMISSQLTTFQPPQYGYYPNSSSYQTAPTGSWSAGPTAQLTPTVILGCSGTTTTTTAAPTTTTTTTTTTTAAPTTTTTTAAPGVTGYIWSSSYFESPITFCPYEIINGYMAYQGTSSDGTFLLSYNVDYGGYWSISQNGFPIAVTMQTSSSTPPLDIWDDGSLSLTACGGTTTTTAAPTTTTTTTTAAPTTTTTTTTAAPSADGISISGSMGEDGAFCPVATLYERPFYKHTSLMWFIWYDGLDWYYGDKIGGTYDPANPTSIVGNLRWLAMALSSSPTAPLTGWGNDLENATITQTSCGGGDPTTTTAAPTTTTTTTTAAPAITNGFILTNVPTDQNFATATGPGYGSYSIEGVYFCKGAYDIYNDKGVTGFPGSYGGACQPPFTDCWVDGYSFALALDWYYGAPPEENWSGWTLFIAGLPLAYNNSTSSAIPTSGWYHWGNGPCPGCNTNPSPISFTFTSTNGC